MKYKIDPKELIIEYIMQLISSLVTFKLLSYLDIVPRNNIIWPAALYSLFVVMITLSTSQIYPKIKKMENTKSNVSIVTCIVLNISIYTIGRYVMILITEYVFENNFYVDGIQGRILIIAIAFISYSILNGFITKAIEKSRAEEEARAMKLKKLEQQKRIQAQQNKMKDQKRAQVHADLSKH